MVWLDAFLGGMRESMCGVMLRAGKTSKRLGLLARKDAKTTDEQLNAQQPAESVTGRSGKVYQSKSLFCLRPGDEPRASAIRLVESPPFDPLILLTIACNCFTMAWESPLDPEGTPKAYFINVCEWVRSPGSTHGAALGGTAVSPAAVAQAGREVPGPYS